MYALTSSIYVGIYDWFANEIPTLGPEVIKNFAALKLKFQSFDTSNIPSKFYLSKIYLWRVLK